MVYLTSLGLEVNIDMSDILSGLPNKHKHISLEYNQESFQK